VEDDGNIRVDLDDVERVLTIVLQHIKQQRSAPIERSDDYYWEINEAQLYDPTKDPSDFSLGQLSEDWARLSQILAGDAPPIGYALVWLASILRAVGQKNVP